MASGCFTMPAGVPTMPDTDVEAGHAGQQVHRAGQVTEARADLGLEHRHQEALLVLEQPGGLVARGAEREDVVPVADHALEASPGRLQLEVPLETVRKIRPSGAGELVDVRDLELAALGQAQRPRGVAGAGLRLPVLGARRVGCGVPEQLLGLAGEPVSGGELALVDGLDELDQLGVRGAVPQQEPGGALYLSDRREVARVRRHRLVGRPGAVELEERPCGRR